MSYARCMSAALFALVLLSASIAVSASNYPGARIGGPIPVTKLSKLQSGPVVARNSTGNFVVAWQSRDWDPETEQYGDSVVRARFYLGGGYVALPVVTVAGMQGRDMTEPAVAMDDAGNATFVWTDNYDGIRLRRFSAAGVPLSPSTRVSPKGQNESQFSPVIAMGKPGNSVVAWIELDASNQRTMKARSFAVDGRARGAAFDVGPATSGLQQWPAIGISNRTILIAWASQGADDNDFGIWARWIDWNTGSPIGSVATVNQYSAGRQMRPAVAMNNGGRAVIAWQSEGQDGDDFAAVARVFMPDGQPVGDEFIANELAAYSQTGVSVVIDNTGKFHIGWEWASFELWGRRFGSAGQPLGSEFLVSSPSDYSDGLEDAGASAADFDGDWVMAFAAKQWDSFGNFYQHIYAQRMSGNKDVDVSLDIPSGLIVPVGGEFDVSIDVSNQNPATVASALGASTGALVRVTLPAGVALSGTAGADWRCVQPSSQLVACRHVEVIAAGADAPPLTVTLRAPETEGTVSLNANLVTDQYDPDRSDLARTGSIQVVGP